MPYLSVRKLGPQPVDAHVGQRVRQRRTLLGMSQEMLGDTIGLTFQQVQKYERGTNRISASRLYQISQVLDIPVSHLFDELPVEVATGQPIGLAEDRRPASRGDPLTKRETLELVRAYYRITNAHARKSLFELIKALGEKRGES